MTFEETFQYLHAESLHPHTLVKYKNDFRGYWKEVVQELCHNYHGGRYRKPLPVLTGFDTEHFVIEEKAREWFYEGLGHDK